MRSNELVEEIDFLKSQGENRQRILDVIAASSVKTDSLKRQLHRKERRDLLEFLFSREATEPVIPDHGDANRYLMGCRCDLCRSANTARHAVFRRAKYDEVKDPNDPRHGKSTFYTNHGCRCLRCTEAHSARCALDQQRRASNPILPDDPRHGTTTFYFSYGCRCEPCRDASRDYYRQRKVTTTS